MAQRWVVFVRYPCGYRLCCGVRIVLDVAFVVDEVASCHDCVFFPHQLCVECVFGGPDRGGVEGQAWLGVQIPKQKVQIRVPVRSCHVNLRPVSTTDAIAGMQVDMIDLLGIQWIHLLFWKTLSTWVLPLVARVDASFSGSALDRHYNGGVSGIKAEETAFLVAMANQIAARFPQRAAQTPVS